MVRRIRRAKWLYPGGDTQAWIDALRAVDERDDTAPLLTLLRSDKAIPGEARALLADLFERYRLKRPQGGRQTPLYKRSDAEAKLIWAAESVRTQGSKIEDAAATYGVMPGTLHNYLAGRYGPARRRKKRLPPR